MLPWGWRAPVSIFNDDSEDVLDSSTRRRAASDDDDDRAEALDASTERGPDPPTRPGSVRSVRKNKLRTALFGRTTSEDRLGRYELRDVLGRGGMGTVVEAYDPTLRRTVALKLLHRDLAETYGARLLGEARALARLSHPNVVHVHEAGQLDGRAFIAMERVHGQSLLEWQASPRPWEQTVDVYRQAGRGLAAAHAAGLVHRDFKPSNCMIDEQDRVKVLDFGLVRDLHRGESSRSTQYPPGRRDSMRLAQTLTRTGAVVGTLVYMSPEQLCGRAVDARSDQFSFCAALYEALYGVRPFDGRSIGELLTAVMDGAPPSTPRGAKIPVRVRKAVLRGLERDADARWPSMDALLLELDRPPRPTRWIVGTGAVAALGIAAATWPRAPTDAARGCRPEDHAAMVDAWEDGARVRVRGALEGHERSHGAHAWQQLEPRLDDFARDWERALETTCRAMAGGSSASRASDAERVRCLGHRRWAFEQTVAVLAEADANTVDRATAIVTGMPRLEDCDDPTVPAPSLGRPNPALGEALARARALTDAERYEDATVPLDAVLAETRGDAPSAMRTEALRLRARGHRNDGNHAEARRALLESFERADAAGDELAAALAIFELVAPDPDPAAVGERWPTWARSRLDRRDLEPRVRGQLARSMAVHLAHGGDSRAALALLERAVEDLGRAHRDDPLHPEVTSGHAQLARLQAASGRLDDAVDHYHHALVRQETLMGREHPALRDTLLALAEAEMARGQPRAARAFARRTIALSPATDGRDAALLARAHALLGDTPPSRGPSP